MTFPTVVFGSYEVGVGYADGESIPIGGLRVFVVPTRNVSAPLDVGITYVDQFGNTKTTTVTTSIPTATGGGTTGAHFMIVLNSGDSGIRDIIATSVVGGTTGDKFNLESWNEGIGRSAYTISRSTPDQVWIQSYPTKDTINFARVFSSWLDFSNTIQTDITISGYPDAQLSLPIETLEPDYENNVADFGFMQPSTTVTKSNSAKKLRIDLRPTTFYQYIDGNEQSTRLKWKWNPSLSQYEDIGFYKLTFDYDVKFDRTNFVFELLDKNGTILWSIPTGAGTGTYTGIVANQVVSPFKSFSWEFRLRCKVSNTTLSTTTDHHVQVTNIRIERYKNSGAAELNYAVDMSNIYKYDSVDINSITPVGTEANMQLALSDNGSTWSNFIGPDGTALTYFEGIGQKVLNPLPLGITGYYYKWKVYLTSDGRDTPILYDITLHMVTRITPKLLAVEKGPSDIYLPVNPKIKSPIVLNTICPRAVPGYPTPPCTGGDYIPEPISGNQFIIRTYPYIRLCPRAIPGYPTPQCTGGDYMPQQPSGRQLTARRLSVFKTWLESVVGQVVSGYVQNTNGDIIKNAFSMILTSTTPTEITPGGFSSVMNVNPDTGLYQAFLKQIIYDKRYVIIKIGLKNIALEGAGIPTFIDGSEKLEIPYNLQFACPVIDCDFNITRKV